MLFQQYLFVLINLDVLAFLDVFKYFSVDYKEGTALRYIDMRAEDAVKFKYDGLDYSAIGVCNFIQAIEQGILKVSWYHFNLVYVFNWCRHSY